VKRLEATPFPAAAISHKVPITALERRIVLMTVAQLSGKKPEAVHDRREVYEALGANGEPSVEWEEERSKQLEPAHYEEVCSVVLSKKMMRTIKELYEEALQTTHPMSGMPFLAGTQSFAFGDFVDRLGWVQTAEAK